MEQNNENPSHQDSEITNQCGSKETQIGMKSQNVRKRNTIFTSNIIDQSRTSTDFQTVTNDEIDPPLPKRIRLALTNTDSGTVNGTNESCNSTMNNDSCSTASMDFDDHIQPLECMESENIESMNINIPSRNDRTAACLQSVQHCNINCSGGSTYSNIDSEDDDPAKFLENSKRRIMQSLFKDYHGSLIPDRDGNFPLHNAVMDRDIKKVMRQCLVLSAHRLTVDIKNKMNEVCLSALHLAVVGQDLEIVKELLKYKANPDIRDSEGNTSLHKAIKWGKNSDILKLLLSEVNDTGTLNLPNYEGLSPLHLCALHNKSDEAFLLVTKHADVNLRDRKSGRSALFHAVENGNTAMVQVLLRAGARIAGLPNFSGQTALDCSELARALLLIAEDN